MTALPQERRYTYADYLAWPEGERVEIIDGQVYDMAPAPSPRHQDISMAIASQIYAYLKGKRCKVYQAPFDVRLFEEDGERPEDVDVIVQPDISIVCDPSKIDGKGCKGAPDMVAEILSPSTRGRDRVQKFNLYAKAGVKEYWLVSPLEGTVQVFTLEGDKYVAAGLYSSGDTVKVAVLDDCTVDLGPVFAE